MKFINLNFFIIYFLLSITTLISCKKEVAVNDVSFDIEPLTLSVKAGDSIIFNINGNPDIISFYSGEFGKDYEYKDNDRILPTEAVTVSFRSQTRSLAGNSANFCQDNQFHIWVTNELDYSNAATMADSANVVLNTDWIEITDKFSISPLECIPNTPHSPAGTVDIKDLFHENKPLHFAFQYINRPNATYGNANSWRFASFTMSKINESNSTEILGQADAAWYPVFIGQGWDESGFGATVSEVTLKGSVTNQVEQEMWCISEKPVYLEDTNLGTDKAIALKGYAQPALKRYAYTYSKPGTYKATFVAANINVYGGKQVVKQIKLTVEP